MDLLAQEMEWLTSTIKDIFGDWESQGFQIKEASLKHTNAMGDYVEIQLSNQFTGRGVVFWYIPHQIHPEGMSIFLINGKGDTFSLNDFLIYKKLDEKLTKSIVLANYQGAFQNKIEALLKTAKTIILQYLKSNLFGNEWESIPIQWGGMK